MLELWQKISHNGVRETQNQELQQNLIIVNRVAFLASILVLPFLIIYIQLQNIVAITLLLVLYIFNAIGLVVINRGNHFWGRLIIWVNSASVALFLSAFITPSQGNDTAINKLLLISFIPLIFMIFNRLEYSAIIILLAAGIFSILAFDWINVIITSKSEFSKPNPTIRFFTLVFSLSLIIISSIYYKTLQAKYSQDLELAKQKSDELLRNILPEQTAEELKEKGYAEPNYYALASVLFTDFKGFTKLADKITPREVIQELNYCFTSFDEICKKYGLERIKTIGDAYMAVGGVPNANESNPEDAVRAALEMQAFMKNWKAEKLQQGLPVWELRLGINSGELIAGVVGKTKFAYDVWGDTVNLASRMESSGEVGTVNISEFTYQLVKDKFTCESRGKIHAKNKGEVDMYFVIGEKT